MPLGTAIGTSLVIVTALGSATAAAYAWSGFVDWQLSLLLVFGGAIGSTVGMLVISTLAIGIFSLYMLYDLKQIIDGGETNYISATLALYLDLFNVFQSLLVLLGVMGGDD